MAKRSKQGGWVRDRAVVLEGAALLEGALLLNRVTVYGTVVFNGVKGSQNGIHLPKRHTTVVRPYGQR